MNLYDLQVKIGLDSTAVTKGIASAGTELKNFGGKIKDGAEQVAKVGAAAIGAASAGVAALAKSATEAYADYEQLVGGVEKLFGDSADLMMMYAQDAYKTAGMSVNEYMETATSFAAALTSSVQAAGGSMDEAVEYADTAMRDMSDNANTFGTDMASIQNAYQGFAKQNYTMLDNLKLGYGGTKAEMERLIEDANKLRREQGINNDLTVESYADIITAIHEVQTAMNITGTTSREASKTISGSINAAKAAWKNLTVEIAKDDGDINSAFDALGGTVGDVIDNIIPRVEKAVGGIGGLISTAAPQVIKSINSLLPKVVPTIIKSAGQLVGAVGQGLLQATPELLDMGKNALKTLSESFTAADIDVDNSVFAKLLGSVADNIPEYLGYAETILANLGNAIINADHSKLGEKIGNAIVSGINSISDLIADLDMQKVGKNIADFVAAVPWSDIAYSCITLLASAIGGLGEAAATFFTQMDGDSFIDALSLIAAPKLLGSMLTMFKSNSECQTNFTSIKDYLSAEIGASGEQGGISWSQAFVTGVKTFGLAYLLTDYLLDNIKINGKSLRELEIDAMTRGIPDEESEFDTAGNTGWINYNGKVMKVDPNSEVYKKYNPSGYNDWLQNYAMTEDEYQKYIASNDYGPQRLTDDTLVPRVAGDVAGQAANNLQARPATKHNTETFRYVQNGVIQTAFKYDEYNQLSEAWKKYGGIAFGDGGRVTRPTIALVGEKEPETIIPDSKRGEFGNTYNNEIHVHIDGTGKNADQIADEAIEVLSRKFDILGIQQQRAVGGKSWA